MIYLIDDNQNNQRSQLGISFVEDGTYKSHLTSIERLEKREQADDISHLEFLKNADCILLHSTTEDWESGKGFLKESTSNVTKIRDYIADYGDKIPLVLFSNKEAQSADSVYQPDKKPHLINLMKKNDFYMNLRDFVEAYTHTSKIELKILMWGKHFQAQEINRLSQILLGGISMKHATDILLLTDLSGNPQIFKNFMELSFPGQNPQIFFNNLEDNPITVSKFREKINLIIASFLKHGKNIYSW